MPIDPLLPDDPDPARPARRLRVGSLCTGHGSLDLAVLRGWLVFVVDPDRHICAVLAVRFPRVPNLDDITRVGFTTLATDPTIELATELGTAPAGRRLVEVLTAGMYCQDIDRRGGIAVGAQIRALGNGVVSLQAQTALRMPPCDASLCVAAAARPETAGHAATAARWAA